MLRQWASVIGVWLGLLLCARRSFAAAQPGPWLTGRATHYGTDAWSIHEGSCGFGWLDSRMSTGWNIAAITDQAFDFKKGMCGKCKEVRCRRASFADGYGQWLERSNVCFDDMQSVVVMITDTCPCYYPDNYVSNKRWCCGDMYHLDMSVWAYKKLAELKWGVIGIHWRDVPCNYRPPRPARPPWWVAPTKAPKSYQQPWGWDKYMDKRLPYMTA